MDKYIGIWSKSGCELHGKVELMYDDSKSFYYCPLCEK